jgi:hypothetical protein
MGMEGALVFLPREWERRVHSRLGVFNVTETGKRAAVVPFDVT